MELIEFLKAETPAEKQIKDYIVANASDNLKEKILKSEKNIADCINWMAHELQSKAKNNCYCGSDQEIYNMAVHYFEEDEIQKNTTPIARIETPNPAAPKPKKEKKVEVKEEPKQMTLFDLEGF